jgi:hypothetical protein
MSACPSRLELSRWEACPEPARPSEFTSHVGTCDRCASILSDISESRALLLGSDPEAASERAARMIMETVRQRRSPSRSLRRWLRYLAPVLLVPAAALFLLVVRPALPSHTGEVKGRIIVETYCKRDGKIFPVADGGEFFAGDQLRFAYTQDRPGYLLVFGVDDAGTIFPYYEENRLVGTPIQAGARVFLPGAVELDSHKGWERIYLIWTEAPLNDAAVRAAVTAALAKAGGDVRRTEALDLPVEQVSLLLRRP